MLRRNVPSKFPLKLWSYSFHTTCAQSAARGRPGRESSRLRLTNNLAPKTERGYKNRERLEVAPRAAYQRESAPHVGIRPRESRTSEYVRQTGDSDRRRRPEDSGRRRRPGDSDGRRRPEDNDRRRLPDSRERPSQRSKFGMKPDYRSGPSRSQHSAPAPAIPRQPPTRTESEASKSPQIQNPLADEFDITTRMERTGDLPLQFTSPPLMDGLRLSIHDVLGEHAKPTSIQSLSLKHLFSPPPKSGWREYLLASETGSGKSFAYMLPMLQDLKAAELTGKASQSSSTDSPRLINPRAIVLAPTHELSRQLSGMAKSLLHNIKLRVLCASQANISLRSSKVMTASKLAALNTGDLSTEGTIATATQKPVDVLVGTTSKILEMVRGHGWNWDKVLQESESSSLSSNKQKKFVVGEPEVGLERVEWVIVDEADVLFDPDFKDATRKLLADIASARGHPITTDTGPINYPFNLLLTSATIPSSLATYLDTHHPDLRRLASPNLHKLPSTLKTEHAAWTSGNRAADIEARIRRIWYGDTAHGSGVRSKVLVFCNKSTKVEEFGKYLADKGIPNLALTSTADSRKRGNNHHINSFLRTPLSRQPSEASTKTEKLEEEPQVLITTSLLSRGLDFSPEIKNVLIVDPPRNMIDFLHRAGRTGRAGSRGTVIVFGKTKGRGVTKYKEAKQKINALT